MSYPVLLQNLITLCRQRCANEGDGSLDDPEYKSLITEVYGELHGLVSEKGARYFETEATITASGAASYALPADHLSTVGVDAIISGTTGPRRPVHGPIAEHDRTRLMSVVGAAHYWALEAANLALFPVPPSGTYMHLYVPQPADYSVASGTTSIDLINIYGRKFVVWSVASIAQHKGSTSQQRAVEEALKAQEQLEYWAAMRAVTQVSHVPHRHLGWPVPQ